MIYDLIQIPIRNMSGELSTVVPNFQYIDGSEEIDFYGKTIDLDRLVSQVFKYKSIESFGNTAIERLFFTQDEIDLKAKWWTTKIPIFPVVYKVFTFPLQARAQVYRYLQGTTDVLDICDCGGHQQTLYNRALRHMSELGCNIPYTPQLNLANKVVSGDDERNLNCYSQLKCAYSDRVITPVSMGIIPQYNTDPTGDIFLSEVDTSRLGILKSNTFGLYNSMVLNAPVPFEIDRNVVFSENEEKWSRWSLHQLLFLLEQASFTDMHIVLEWRSQRDVVATTDLFSRYLGFTARQIPGQQQFKQDLINALRKWTNMTIPKGTAPSKVELTKTWLEEVYIVVTANGCEHRYFFDLATYGLANMSFVDMLG